MSKPWEKAMELEHFIHAYIPKGWVEPIGKVFPYPYMLVEEYEGMFKGIYPERFNDPTHREAIEVYFKKEDREQGR